MGLFFITMAIMIFVIAIMAVGVIFSNREIKGSCGGLGNIIGEECSFCGKKDECERKKQQLAAQE